MKIWCVKNYHLLLMILKTSKKIIEKFEHYNFPYELLTYDKIEIF